MIHLTFESWVKGIPTIYGGTRAPQAAMELEKKFRGREQLLIDRRQQLAVGVSKSLVETLQRVAPRKTGKFAAGITMTPSENFFGETTVQIQAAGEHAFLLPFFVHGTKAHEIPTGGAAAQMAKGYPLKFYWQNGPNGPGVYRYWRVWHPGTKPNPFIDKAVNGWLHTARMVLSGVAMDVAADKTSASI